MATAKKKTVTKKVATAKKTTKECSQKAKKDTSEKSVQINLLFEKIFCEKNRNKILKEIFAQELIKVLMPKDKKIVAEFKKNAEKLVSQFEIKSKSVELYMKNGKNLELVGKAK